MHAGLEESLLIFLMEIINKECVKLDVLDLSLNSAGGKFIDLLRVCIENKELQKLRLAGMGITSKMLCVLAIGIAKNASLEELDLKDNLIGFFSHFSRFFHFFSLKITADSRASRRCFGM